MNSHAPRSPFVPVYRLRIKCPVCGKPDNCAVSEDRARAYCRRVASEHPGIDGGYLHVLSDDAPAPPTLKAVRPQPAPVVDRGVRSAVYESFLHALPLLTPHLDNLKTRGLSIEAVERGEFRSTPTEGEADALTLELAARHDLAGIPGFYKDRDRWRLVAVPSGFFVPVRDRHGLIQGLQIRKDHRQEPRYIWLSSKGRPFGTGSGAPCHVQNPERVEATGKLIITEGSLKSFVAAQYLGESEGGLLALAGVGTFKDSIGAHLRAAWPSLRHVSVAFDSDWREKREVKRQLHRLLCALKAARFDVVTVRTWDGPEKGIDDFLVAEARERREVAA
jgi:DNA primase